MRFWLPPLSSDVICTWPPTYFTSHFSQDDVDAIQALYGRYTGGGGGGGSNPTTTKRPPRRTTEAPAGGMAFMLSLLKLLSCGLNSMVIQWCSLRKFKFYRQTLRMRSCAATAASTQCSARATAATTSSRAPTTGGSQTTASRPDTPERLPRIGQVKYYV